MSNSNLNQPPENRKDADYLAIRLWGRELGSFDYYIKGEQARACEDAAPLDAIYKGQDGVWRCVSDLIKHHDFRELYERELAKREA